MQVHYITSMSILFSDTLQFDMEKTARNHNLNSAILFATNNQSAYCAICGAEARADKYGTLCCLGCKDFFHRSVKKNSIYKCSATQNCTIDKGTEKMCRYCRLKKCFAVGMKWEAVKNESERISTEGPDGLTVMLLLKSEMYTRRFMHGLIMEDLENEIQKQFAGINDIFESIKQQLFILVKWAKCIPAFNKLPIDDQLTLLSSHAGEQLLLVLARRSMHLKNILLLGNNCIVTKFSIISNEHPDLDISHISSRIIDELVCPMNDIGINDAELAVIKALILFDPNTENLIERERVRSLRKQILNNFEDYEREQRNDSRSNFGQILLILPTLLSISVQMVEKIKLSKLYDVVPIDGLLEEMFSLNDETQKYVDIEDQTITSTLDEKIKPFLHNRKSNNDDPCDTTWKESGSA